MNLYQTMFTRRSVRQYEKDRLNAETLSAIQAYINETKQFDGQNARFKVVTGEEANINHPYAILAYCDADAAAYANIGFVLEKADLYIQSIGLGSLWLGMAKPKDAEKDFCVMLAFGRTSVPFRSGEADFNRLPLAEISDSDSNAAKAARLAPSAVNSQPWKLSFSENSVIISYSGRGMMKAMLKKKLSKIDLGICTRFVVEALRYEGMHIKSITPQDDGGNFYIKITYENT